MLLYAFVNDADAQCFTHFFLLKVRACLKKTGVFTKFVVQEINQS